MNNFQQVSKQDVIRNLLRNCGISYISDENIVRDIVLAEYLRSSLHELSLEADDDQGFAPIPIYIGRLINVVSGHLEAVWKDLRRNRNKMPVEFDDMEKESSDTKLVRRIIDRLELLGDCTNLGNGYWMPTPVRLVRIPSSDEIVVVGGISTRKLQYFIPEVQLAGFGRRISGLCNSVDINADLIWQDYHKWVGWMPEDVLTWTSEEIEKILTEGSKSSNTFIDFDVYISEKGTRYRVKTSWVPARLIMDMSNSGIMLCRVGKPYRFFLGEFSKGQLVRERFVDEKDVHWLMLGLRLMNGFTPLAVWDRNYLKVYGPLPRALERHLSVYSCAVQSKEKNFLYYVPSFFKFQIEQFLQQFGYHFRHVEGE